MTTRLLFIIIAVLVLATGCDWVDVATVSTAGDPADNHSVLPAVSDDGHIVAYSSIATNLVAGDTNGTQDIFVRDHAAGTTVRASVASNGKQANGASYRAQVSDDGRYVVFHSAASNLVPGDTNGVTDVFRHDLVTGETIRVSVPNGPGEPDGASEFAAIDGDGDVVAFMSAATNLVAADGNGLTDVFVRDVSAGTTTRVSLDHLGAELTAESRWPSIDDAGDRVSFVTTADLVLEDGNAGPDAYVVERASGTIHFPTHGDVLEDDLSAPAISGDGTHLAYVAEDPHFILDTNGEPDVYRAELSGSYPHRIVSWEIGFPNADGASSPSISDDGREVTFRSTDQFTANDSDNTWDVYTWFIGDNAGDFANVVLVDVDRFRDVEGDGVPGGAMVSGDGGFVAWATSSTNVVPGDTNGVVDIVLRSIATPWSLTADPTNPTIAPGTTEQLEFTGTVIDPAADVWLFGAAGVTIDSVAHTDFDTIVVTVTADPGAGPGGRTLVVENPAAAWDADAGSGDLCSFCVVVGP